MRFPLGVILGGALLFMWGFVFWTLLPFSKSIIKPVTNYDDMKTSLEDYVGESGVYLAPEMPGDMSDADAVSDWEKRHRNGPVYMLFYNQEGKEPMSPKVMAKGFGHSVGVAFIGALVLLAASPRNYANRVMLVFWTAIFGTVWADIGNVIWWHFPWNYSLLQMAYHIGGGLVLGLVLAAFISPDPDMA